MVRLPSFIVFDVAEDIGNEVSKIQEKLIPSWVSFVVQFAALIVLITIVFFVAYKPMKKMLQKRADYVESNIRDAERSNAEAQQNAEQSREIVLASKKEAAQILINAQNQAEEDKKAIIEDGQKEVAKMKENAEKDIERAQQEAIDAIHNEMVEVAINASSHILQREVNQEDNKRFAEDFIKNLN